jgi:hypothetical protein
MNDFEIESRTFYKMPQHSTQIFEKTYSGNPQRISLPRVKFLEVDGTEYRPKWAIDYTPKEEREHVPPAAPILKNITPRRLALRFGELAITELEQTVYDMYAQGMTCEDICEKTGKNASIVNAAYGRFKNKTLSKNDKN